MVNFWFSFSIVASNMRWSIWAHWTHNRIQLISRRAFMSAETSEWINNNWLMDVDVQHWRETDSSSCGLRHFTQKKKTCSIDIVFSVFSSFPFYEYISFFQLFYLNNIVFVCRHLCLEAYAVQVVSHGWRIRTYKINREIILSVTGFLIWINNQGAACERCSDVIGAEKWKK